MQKILIIGGGIEQVAAIRIAKEMGLMVICTDINMSAPGIKYADFAFKISTTDFEGNLKIAKKEKINGVMTICSETAVPTVAKVAAKLNLPGFSELTSLRATNKAEMRKVLDEYNIKMSPYVIATNINQVQKFTEKNSGPWVFKPVDSSGQRGSSIVSNKEKLECAFNNAIKFSEAKKVLLDQFVKGPEIHVTMQIINKEVHFLAFSDRITLNESNFGIAVRHLGPSLISKKIKSKIEDMCVESVAAIGLENGISTCELILHNDEPILMEVAVRVPGGYLRDVAMHLSGVDIIKTTIWTCLGINKTINEMITENKYSAISVKFISVLNLNSSIKKISDVTHKNRIYKINGIKFYDFHFDSEIVVPELNSSVGRFGVIISIGSSRKEAVETTEAAFNSIYINKLKLSEYTNYNKFNLEFN